MRPTADAIVCRGCGDLLGPFGFIGDHLTRN
jgi:hypothetical protein